MNRLISGRTRICQACKQHLNTTARSSTSSSSSSSSSTANESELEHFSKLASEWWQPNSEYRVLSRMNEPRVAYLRERLARDEPELLHRASLLKGKSVLDVGCGGGIFAETLARLGGDTLGIDAAPANVEAAQGHARLDPGFASARWKLQYQHSTAEALLAEKPGAFDVVASMEVLEHVDQPRTFLASLAGLTKPGGTIILSTISRTAFAYLLTIAIAEHSPFGFAAPGTHTYSKYVRPSEISDFFQNDMGWKTERGEARGVMYLPWAGKWQLGQREQRGSWFNAKDRLANYFFAIKKPLNTT